MDEPRRKNVLDRVALRIDLDSQDNRLERNVIVKHNVEVVIKAWILLLSINEPHFAISIVMMHYVNVSTREQRLLCPRPQVNVRAGLSISFSERSWIKVEPVAVATLPIRFNHTVPLTSSLVWFPCEQCTEVVRVAAGMVLALLTFRFVVGFAAVDRICRPASGTTDRGPNVVVNHAVTVDVPSPSSSEWCAFATLTNAIAAKIAVNFIEGSQQSEAESPIIQRLWYAEAKRRAKRA